MISAWLTGRPLRLKSNIPLSLPSLNTRITGRASPSCRRRRALHRARATAASAHRRDHLRQRVPQLADVARERRTDGDVAPERADAHEVIGTEPREELFGGVAQQRQVASMLPDTSSITISLMGWGVLSNSVIGCGLPSSRTSKSSVRARGRAGRRHR